MAPSLPMAHDRRLYLTNTILLLRRNSVFERQRPAHAVCAIHNFDRPGLDGYWQRHGIAAASAALNGGLVVGAAHFESGLPLPTDRSPLAAAGLKPSYLRLGQRRPLIGLAPSQAMVVKAGPLSSLVRLFEAPNDR
jgi:hypothetical protein